MRIGLNALQVRAAKSGVGQYIDGLIDGLTDHLAPDDRLIVYATPLNASNYERSDPRVELVRFGPAAGRAARLAYEWAFFPARIAQDRLDIFHGPANFLPRSLPCPAVVTIHDASRWTHPERFPAGRLRYWKWMTARTLAHGSRIVTDSEASRRDLLLHLKVIAERVEVVPLAAHPRFRPIDGCSHEMAQLAKYNIGAPYILHVGTLEPGKNLARLIEAFALLKAQLASKPITAISSLRPDLRLVLAGDAGWKFEDIAGAVARLHLEDFVRILGHVPDDDLPLLYNAAELFAFPSLNEGFGLPPLEAMACGTPVVASNTSALPEVLGDGALLANPLDPVAFAASMRMVLKYPEPWIHAGRARAGRYSWYETGRRTMGVYKKVLLHEERATMNHDEGM